MMSNCGTRGTITRSIRGFRKESAEHFAGRKRTKKWTGWRPRTDEQKIEFKKKVVENGEDRIDQNWATIQKCIEIAAGKVAHHM